MLMLFYERTCHLKSPNGKLTHCHVTMKDVSTGARRCGRVIEPPPRVVILGKMRWFITGNFLSQKKARNILIKYSIELCLNRHVMDELVEYLY